MVIAIANQKGGVGKVSGALSSDDATETSTWARHVAPNGASPEACTAGEAHDLSRARPDHDPECLLSEPPERLLRALGPVPVDEVAREQWAREAQRLEALGPQTSAKHQPPSGPARRPSPELSTRQGPGAPPTAIHRHTGPTIGR